MGCSSTSGNTDYKFTLELMPKTVPESPATMTNRPYATLTITLVTQPSDPSFTKRLYLSSGGTSGLVSFDNDAPEVISGTPFNVKVYGKTVSTAKDATKIIARLGPTADPCEQISITVWKVSVEDGGSSISEDSYRYITTAPAMPTLQSRLLPAGLTGTVTWDINIEYKRPNRNDETGWGMMLDVGTPWNISGLFNSLFYGGKLTLTATLDGLNRLFIFYIRGTNPSEAVAAVEIGGSPWYARAIARVESTIQLNRTYLQFNIIGTLGPNWTDIKDCPNRSSDIIGWGMYQLTNPPAAINQLWNWKANIAEAKTRMAGHRIQATNWINSQEAQQQVDNPNKPLANAMFTYGTVSGGVVFQKGTAKTPVDACAIEAYNGATPGWAIWWDGTQWKQRDNINNYVAKVCDEYKRAG